VSPLLDYLFTARPTAVNLGGAIARLRTILAAAELSGDPKALAKALIAEARAVADEDVGRNRAMGAHGADWLIRASGDPDGGLNVLTVCNTGSLATSGYGTALGVITRLHEMGKLRRAYFTQSAPYHQGSRLTAMELLALGVPCTMICDTMVGSLFQSQKIHGVVVGADRIARNGDTANKVCLYMLADDNKLLIKTHCRWGRTTLLFWRIITLFLSRPSHPSAPSTSRSRMARSVYPNTEFTIFTYKSPT
jgi:methylthioribose-1-phosphate isomerase